MRKDRKWTEYHIVQWSDTRGWVLAHSNVYSTKYQAQEAIKFVLRPPAGITYMVRKTTFQVIPHEKKPHMGESSRTKPLVRRGRKKKEETNVS